MDNNDKKGFAGFNKLASDIVVEAPAEEKTELQPEETISTNIDSPNASIKNNFFKNLFKRKNKPTVIPSKPSGKGGNYWWLILPVLAGLSHLNDGDKKPVAHTASHPPVASHQEATHPAAEQSVQVRGVIPKDDLALVPLPSNYHPHIRPYTATPMLDSFERITNSSTDFTEENFKMFSDAAAAGNIDAQYAVAVLTKFGKGTKKDEKTGNIMLLGSAQNDHPYGLRDVSWQLKDSLRVDYLMRAALLGDDRAEYLVGQAYYKGSFIERDYNKALYWFVKSAAQLNSDAQLAIGVMYMSGYGMAKDDTKGFAWALKAANQFNPHACALVAGVYADDTNIMVQKDLGAAYYFLSCADQKDADIIKLKADIMPKMTEADFEHAADLSSRDAMIKLAKDYHYGIGVQKNNYKAAKYLQMYGYKNTDELRKLENEVVSEMEPATLKAAQEDSMTWFAHMIGSVKKAEDDRKSAYKASRVEEPYLYEIIPDVGTYPLLERSGLRWCVYQKKRINYINHQVPADKSDDNSLAHNNAKYVTDEIGKKMDALIADYNARCPDARQYREADIQVILNELKDPIYLNQIALDAQKIMLGWDRRFWFRE